MSTMGVVLAHHRSEGAALGDVASPAEAGKEQQTWRTSQPKRADDGSQSSGASTCSCADDSGDSPFATSATPVAGDASPHADAPTDEDAAASPRSPAKVCSSSAEEARLWSKSTCWITDHADGAPSGEEDDESEKDSDQDRSMGERHERVPGPPSTDAAIAEKLALMGQAGLVSTLATILSHLASLDRRPRRPTLFHATRPPPIPIQDYLTRIAKYYACSDSCLVLALLYIDRAVKLHPQFAVDVLNVHRLLAVSVMLAAKFLDDVYYSNAHYAKVAGLSVSEMNKLEETFLNMLNWRVFVQPAEYEMIVDHVLRAAGVAA